MGQYVIEFCDTCGLKFRTAVNPHGGVYITNEMCRHLDVANNWGSEISRYIGGTRVSYEHGKPIFTKGKEAKGELYYVTDGIEDIIHSTVYGYTRGVVKKVLDEKDYSAMLNCLSIFLTKKHREYKDEILTKVDAYRTKILKDLEAPNEYKR